MDFLWILVKNQTKFSGDSVIASLPSNFLELFVPLSQPVWIEFDPLNASIVAHDIFNMYWWMRLMAVQSIWLIFCSATWFGHWYCRLSYSLQNLCAKKSPITSLRHWLIPGDWNSDITVLASVSDSFLYWNEPVSITPKWSEIMGDFPAQRFWKE